MYLELNAFGNINIQDPYPSEGALAVQMEDGETRIEEVSGAQFLRLVPQMNDLVTKTLLTYKLTGNDADIIQGFDVDEAAPGDNYVLLYKTASGEYVPTHLTAALLGTVNYLGVWDANANSPVLQSGIGTKGGYYVVSVPGNTNLDGITDWSVNDWAIFNGTVWEKVDNSELVISVAGRAGVVVLSSTDITDFSAAVGAHPAVSANTSARHGHTNKGELDLVTDGDHDVRTDNPHAVTKSQAGLGNVTNDAQLKRAAADFASFSEKTVPVPADILLIEDSDAAGVKKKIQIANLPSLGSLYFFSSDLSDIGGGYESLLKNPSLNSEDDDSVVVNSGSGEVLIDSYATVLNDPGIIEIPTGLWKFHMFHYVDNATGVTQYVYRVYKRASGGAETELFNVTSVDVDVLVATQIITNYTTVSPIVLLATDRIVVKVYAKTTSVPNRTAHFVYEGDTRVSYIETPVSATGSGGGSTSVFFPAETSSAKYNYRVRGVGGVGAFNYNFVIPDDFASLISVELIGFPVATFSNKTINLSSQYGAIGELYNQHAESNTLSASESGVADTFFAIDLSSVFSSLIKNDLCGVNVDHVDVGSTVSYLGILLKYNS